MLENFPRKRAYFLGILSIVLVAATLSFLSWKAGPYAESRTIGKDVVEFEELSDRFETLADKKGAVYAFEVLRRAPLPPQTDLHLLGHVVGDKLYSQEGISGIQYCTQDFRNACSHSIVIGALTELGEGALPEIRDACRKAPGGPGAYTMCFHGLGHGVFAGYGYELPETIDFCELTGTEDYNHQEYTECFGGAVMELTGGGGHDQKLWEDSREKYLSEDPIRLCMSDIVPERLKGICLTYITPEIWTTAGIELGSPDPSKFSEAFEYCNSIPLDKPYLRDACYGGFGKEFVPLAGARDIRQLNNYSDDQLRIVAQWCEYAGTEDGVGYCTSEALDSLFWGGENDPSISFRFCDIVEHTGAQQKCYRALNKNIHRYIPDQEIQRALCAQLPEEYATSCQGE